MIDKRKGFLFLISVIKFAVLSVGTLSAQTPPFEIEGWEKGINERQPPADILDAIGAKTGMVIGEVGAGTGRMTLWLAWRVRETGRRAPSLHMSSKE